jgi:hypothetical protein
VTAATSVLSTRTSLLKARSRLPQPLLLHRWGGMCSLSCVPIRQRADSPARHPVTLTAYLLIKAAFLTLSSIF